MISLTQINKNIIMYLLKMFKRHIYYGYSSVDDVNTDQQTFGGNNCFI